MKGRFVTAGVPRQRERAGTLSVDDGKKTAWKQSANQTALLSVVGARSESRTRTPVRAVDFESTASTDSAIRAHAGENYWPYLHLPPDRVTITRKQTRINPENNKAAVSHYAFPELSASNLSGGDDGCVMAARAKLTIAAFLVDKMVQRPYHCGPSIPRIPLKKKEFIPMEKEKIR